jgi:tetratricopeptide (TPR) repeat protein
MDRLDCCCFSLCPALSVFGQVTTCPSISVRAATEADKAYSEERYADAERLYTQAWAERPKDVELSAALVRTLLHEGEVSRASARVNDIFPNNSRSPVALTALAEVQLRQGLPWQAMKSLDVAMTINPCYARSHLIRSRVLRIDPMYASERTEIQRAFEIDPADPDIQSEWRYIVSSAEEVKSIDQSLSTVKDLDIRDRRTVEASTRSLMLRLSENSQTCQVLRSLALPHCRFCRR